MVLTAEDISAVKLAIANALEPRFTQIDNQFVQIDRRDAQFNNQFAQLDNRFTQLDERVAQFNNQFAQLDNRFTQLDERFPLLDNRFAQIEDLISNLNHKFNVKFTAIELRLDSIEYKLSQIAVFIPFENAFLVPPFGKQQKPTKD